ncbi:MAG: hypothetical protein GTN40_01375 [Candidatus Aenigmarchaeota archaeon]|nr:hypothetical protein [Candidatus Aenigmarchaeota archaeon]
MEKTSMSWDEIEEKLKGNRHALIQFWKNSGQQEKIDKLKAEEFRETLKTAEEGNVSGLLNVHLMSLRSNPLISKDEIRRAAEILFEYLMKKDEPWNALKYAYKYDLGLGFLRRAAEAKVRKIIDGGLCYDQTSAIAVIREGWVKNQELTQEFLQNAYKVYFSSHDRFAELLGLVTEFPQYFSGEQKEIARALSSDSSPIHARKNWEEDQLLLLDQ